MLKYTDHTYAVLYHLQNCKHHNNHIYTYNYAEVRSWFRQTIKTAQHTHFYQDRISILLSMPQEHVGYYILFKTHISIGIDVYLYNPQGCHWTARDRARERRCESNIFQWHPWIPNFRMLWWCWYSCIAASTGLVLMYSCLYQVIYTSICLFILCVQLNS